MRGIQPGQVIQERNEQLSGFPQQINECAGSLQQYYSEWAKITDDIEVLDAVLGYRLPFISNPPKQSSIPHERQFSEVEKKQLDVCIKRLVEINAVTEVSACSEQFVSPIFIVPKPDGTGRFIINLKFLNEHIEYRHFKMEDARTVRNLLTLNCFMAKLDLQDAYDLIPIHEDHRKYIRFLFNGILYEFNCLPFGLSTSPRIYTKVMRPVLAKLRSEGYISVNYLDDFLFIGNSVKSCSKNVQATIRLLHRLGFVINYRKSELIPKQEIEYLGFIFNSQTLTMKLPDRKKEKILKLISNCLKFESQSVGNIASLVGNLIASVPAIECSMIHIKYIEIDKTSALIKSQGDYESLMTISEATQNDLKWWVKVLPTAFTKLKQDTFDTMLTTDASPTGWGAHTKNRITHGFWSQNDRLLHINTLELMAVYNALCSLFKLCRNMHILIRTDSTTCMAYINRQGWCHSLANLKIAHQIWSWCERQGIALTASYINTKANVIADKESRLDADANDFEIDHNSFELICLKFGFPTIDLFASTHTKKCTRYVSWYPDPDCFGVDAFTLKWDRFFYAFHPFSLITRVLKKIQDDKARGIVVLPNWKSQAWFPIFMQLCDSKILTLKRNKFSLSFPLTRELHPLSKTLSLIVAVVSGSK